MPDVTLLAGILVWAAAIGQMILLWLQLQAYFRFKHTSFAVLAAGTFLGLSLSVVSLLSVLIPDASQSFEKLFVFAMIGAIAQIPVAIWGVAWLFRSYGQLRLESEAVRTLQIE